jgi:hypothetical protein
MSHYQGHVVAGDVSTTKTITLRLRPPLLPNSGTGKQFDDSAQTIALPVYTVALLLDS